MGDGNNKCDGCKWTSYLDENRKCINSKMFDSTKDSTDSSVNMADKKSEIPAMPLLKEERRLPGQFIFTFVYHQLYHRLLAYPDDSTASLRYTIMMTTNVLIQDQNLHWANGSQLKPGCDTLAKCGIVE